VQAALVFPASSAAAQLAPLRVAEASQAPDDVAWEERRVPYDGEPVRPGAQLDGSTSGLVWAGALIFALSYTIGGVYVGLPDDDDPDGSFDGRAMIPLVGPLLAEISVLSVLTTVGEVAGVVLFVVGLLQPSLTLVYDAPQASGAPYAAARLAPAAF